MTNLKRRIVLARADREIGILRSRIDFAERTMSAGLPPIDIEEERVKVWQMIRLRDEVAEGLE